MAKAKKQKKHAATHKSQIGFLLRKAYQRNSAIWQSNCFDPQLTSVQAAAMRNIYHNEPCSLIELARAAAMDPATTRGVIDRLRERGLISLSEDSRDRRKVIVRLEDEGRALVERLPPMLKKISALTMQRLNAKERVTLRRLLEKMTAEDEFGQYS